MISKEERDVYDHLLAQARGKLDGLQAQKAELEERIAMLDGAIASAEQELVAVEKSLKPLVDGFDAAEAKVSEESPES